MKFKNTKTGIVWDVTDDTHIKRLSNHPEFEEVKENKTTTKNTKTQTQSNKTTTKTTTKK